MKISVKMGSNLIDLKITRTTCCKDLIEMVLKQSKFGKLEKRSCFKSNESIKDEIINNYALFERAMGIERQVKNEENIYQLWSRVNKYNPNNFQLVIKLCPRSKLLSKRIQIISSKSSEKIFKKYKKQMFNLCANHTYEQIDIVAAGYTELNHSDNHERSSLLRSCLISVYSTISEELC